MSKNVIIWTAIKGLTMTICLYSYLCQLLWPPWWRLGQRNVNILQHLQSDRRSDASTKLVLNLPIHFYLNNVTNLYQLSSQSTTACPTPWISYRDHILLWRHLNLSVYSRLSCTNCVSKLSKLRAVVCQRTSILCSVQRPGLLVPTFTTKRIS